MAMNFERDGDARGGPSLSFRHYPAIFVESRIQPGIEIRCISSGTRHPLNNLNKYEIRVKIHMKLTQK
jgi:hypothetical protein